jgi:hypothetical protein
VEERSKDFTIVVSTDKITIAVTILFTVTFPLHTRGVRTAAAGATAINIASTASWASLRLFYTRGLGLHTAVILGVEERPKSLAVVVATDKTLITVTVIFTVTFPLHTRAEY